MKMPAFLKLTNSQIDNTFSKMHEKGMSANALLTVANQMAEKCNTLYHHLSVSITDVEI